jgi:hypothetical protein
VDDIRLALISKFSEIADKTYLQETFTRNFQKIQKDIDQCTDFSTLNEKFWLNYQIMLAILSSVQLDANNWGLILSMCRKLLTQNNEKSNDKSFTHKFAYRTLETILDKVHYTYLD